MRSIHSTQIGEQVQGPARGIAALIPFETAEQQPRLSPLADEVTALFYELRNPLLRYILSLGLSPQDGEDIVQEVFLSLFRHLRQDKSRENLRGWIFRVGHNLTLKRRIQNGRNAEAALGDSCEWVLPDPAPNPEERVLLDRQQARLRAVVYALPERDRCCLNLRAEGLQYREIAEALDISIGAVALSLSRSLAKLSCVVER